MKTSFDTKLIHLSSYTSCLSQQHATDWPKQQSFGVEQISPTPQTLFHLKSISGPYSMVMVTKNRGTFIFSLIFFATILNLIWSHVAIMQWNLLNQFMSTKYLFMNNIQLLIQTQEINYVDVHLTRSVGKTYIFLLTVSPTMLSALVRSIVSDFWEK